MFHPIVTTVLGHPELIAEHLANYGALIREERAQTASQGLLSKLDGRCHRRSQRHAGPGSGRHCRDARRAAWQLPLGAGGSSWVAIVIALFSALAAARPRPFHAFDDLRSQLDADVRALRVAGERHGR